MMALTTKRKRENDERRTPALKKPVVRKNYMTKNKISENVTQGYPAFVQENEYKKLSIPGTSWTR
jgi:hypothetical protein